MINRVEEEEEEEEEDSDSERNALFSRLLDGPDTDDWSLNPDGATPDIKKTVSRMFQLTNEGATRSKNVLSGNVADQPILKIETLDSKTSPKDEQMEETSRKISQNNETDEEVETLHSKTSSEEDPAEGRSSEIPENNEPNEEGFICTINDPDEVDSLKRKDLDYHRCVPFFIRDLYEATSELNYFLYKTVPFTRVFIIGRIVEIGESDKCHFFHVSDDERESIRCIISKKYHSKLVQGVRIKRTIDGDDERPVSLGVDFSTVPSFRGIRGFVPDCDRLDIGDVLRIVGRFAKRGSERSIFIDKFTKETEDVLNMHLRTLSEFYHSS
ncbi:unnamed protein product [Phyllotreta striolata]|uniref:Uncharacterized protein n=1 Tax=Phyllotreta striolata TaxID=444603 RepID=A0A9N9TXH5_PHYSR|nr:unnamed protein product [Phyllotreta striolata]